MSDYMVTVCKTCRCASCWHGEFYCNKYRDSDLVDVPASQLDREANEHPSWYSKARLMEVCGVVRDLNGNRMTTYPVQGER